MYSISLFKEKNLLENTHIQPNANNRHTHTYTYVHIRTHTFLSMEVVYILCITKCIMWPTDNYLRKVYYKRKHKKVILIIQSNTYTHNIYIYIRNKEGLF